MATRLANDEHIHLTTRRRARADDGERRASDARRRRARAATTGAGGGSTHTHTHHSGRWPAHLDVASARLELADRQLDRAQGSERTGTSTNPPPPRSLKALPGRCKGPLTARPHLKGGGGGGGAQRYPAGRLHTTRHMGKAHTRFTSNCSKRQETKTLLATLVSLDPIYFDFDMSEADFLRFPISQGRREIFGKLRLRSAMTISTREKEHSISWTTC